MASRQLEPCGRDDGNELRDRLQSVVDVHLSVRRAPRLVSALRDAVAHHECLGIKVFENSVERSRGGVTFGTDVQWALGLGYAWGGEEVPRLDPPSGSASLGTTRTRLNRWNIFFALAFGS